MLKLINPPRPEAAEHRARTASVEPGKVPRGIHVDAIKGEIELLEGRKGDRAKAEIARLEKHLERVEQHRTPAEVKAAREAHWKSHVTFRKKRVAESLIFRKSRIVALQQTIASDRAQPASSWRDARIKKNQKSLSYLLNAKTGLTDGLPPNWPNVSDDDIKHWVLENAREPSRQVVNMGRRRRR